MHENDIRINDSIYIPSTELSLRTSRSGGPGGQNVNKVESKVELLFDVRNSASLTDKERHIIFDRLGNKIDSDGILHISSQISRSQLENREIVVSQFIRVLRIALKPVKKRVPTRPTKTSREKRLKNKKITGERKKMRSARIID